jgi:hypothetical protein
MITKKVTRLWVKAIKGLPEKESMVIYANPSNRALNQNLRNTPILLTPTMARRRTTTVLLQAPILFTIVQESKCAPS